MVRGKEGSLTLDREALKAQFLNDAGFGAAISPAALQGDPADVTARLKTYVESGLPHGEAYP